MIPSGYKEDTVYSAVPTDGSGDLAFTRASNGTRINSAGLVEVCPWNLQTYSEDFTNGKYTLNQASISSNATTAPNGTATADKLVENTANDQHFVYFTAEQIAYNETRISVYAKAGGRTNLLMWESAITNAQCLFNLSTGVVTSSSSGNAANLSTTVGQIEDAGNGWYRCSFNYSTSSGGGTIRLQLYTTTTSYTGDGTSGIFLWGLQENIGSTAKPYFPTTDRLNVPRLTYQNGGGGCPSLLLEKQSTNLVTYSEQFDNWSSISSSISITANNTISPDGTQNADKLVENNQNVEHFIYSNVGTYASAVYTVSVYAKAGERSILQLLFNGSTNIDAFANFDLTNGVAYATSSTATMTAVGNGWYRCTITATLTAATLPLVYFFIQTSTSATRAQAYAGNGTSGLYLWGAQSEQSSYVTSLINTTSASATRVADECSKTGISSLIGQTEGTLFWQIQRNDTDNDSRLQISDGTTNNWLFVSIETGLNPRAYCNVGGVNQFSAYGSAVSNSTHKVAFAYKSNDFKVYIDGVAVITETSGSVPACTRLDVGSGSPSGPVVSTSLIKEVVLFKTRLTNAELASLTTI
jgi:hypothetical protein